MKKRRGVGGEEGRSEEGEDRREVDESRELWRWRRFESINMKDSSMGFRVFAGGEGSVSGGRGGKTG